MRFRHHPETQAGETCDVSDGCDGAWLGEDEPGAVRCTTTLPNGWRQAVAIRPLTPHPFVLSLSKDARQL